MNIENKIPDRNKLKDAWQEFDKTGYEFCTPGSVRGQSGNWLSFLDPTFHIVKI